MNYVLEGPDGVGKTTLGQKLSEKYNLELIHLGYDKDINKLTSTFDSVYEKLKNGGVIVDRWILSNIIYSNVFNGQDNKIADTRKYFDILKNSTVLIMCLPSNKTQYLDNYERLCKEREELFVDREKMGMVYDQFNDYFNFLTSSASNLFTVGYDMFKSDTVKL